MRRAKLVSLVLMALVMVLICGCSAEEPVNGTGGSHTLRGTVRITGMSDAGGCEVTVERQIAGTRSASVFSKTSGVTLSRSVTDNAVFTTTTAASGVFSVSGLPDGLYIVTVKKADTLGAVVKDVAVGNVSRIRAVVDLDIVLTATGRMSGRVTLDGVSGDLYGTFVYAEGTSYIAATDAAGNFVLKDIPVGTYNIVVYHEGFFSTLKTNVTIQAAIDNPVGTVNLAKISDNVYLSGLTTSAGSFAPAFSKHISFYNLSLDGSIPSLTVTPTAEDAAATIRVNGEVVASGTPSSALVLNSDQNVICVDVISAKGSIRTYTMLAPDRVNLTLSALTVNTGTLTPVFNPTVNEYRVYVPNSTTSITVSGTNSDVNASIEYSPSQNIPLNVNSNPVKVYIVSPDRSTTNTYKVTVIRLPALSGIGVIGQTLTPSFQSAVTNYLINMTSTSQTIDISGGQNATTSYSYINYIPMPLTGTLHALNAGTNVISIRLVSWDHTATNTYKVTVVLNLQHYLYYNANGATGGSVPSAGAAYTNGQTITVLPNFNNLVKSGYAFKCWNTQANGLGTDYLPGSTYIIGSQNVTLYAKWVPAYVVTFNSQGGSSVPAQNVEQGGLLMKPMAPTRSGYTFDGWYKELACVTAWNFSSDIVVNHMTLYAKWTLICRGLTTVTSSSTGAVLYATTSSGGVYYKSTDSGVTWAYIGVPMNFRKIACSSDGSKLAAIVSGGQIYTSTDSGVHWLARDSARWWSDIACSATGTKLVATVAAGGQIYTSTDSGATWTARGSNLSWNAVISSSDGTRLAALGLYYAFFSQNSGLTWSQLDTGFTCLAGSSDGLKLVGAAERVTDIGHIYTSVDSGVTWIERKQTSPIRCVASSSDGTKMVAGEYIYHGTGGQIYTSTDSGITWTARGMNLGWVSLASSSDGTKVAAVSRDGYVYTSTDSGATWALRF